MRSNEWVMVGVVVALGIGCGGTSSGPDGGGSGDGGGSDAGEIADAGVTGDAGPELDAGMPCAPACGSGETCLGGVCVASCGGDLSALEGALGDGLTIVANVCRTVSGPIDVVENAGALRVYDLASTSAGTTTTLTLSRWTLDPDVATPTVSVVATTTHEVPSMDDMTFASGYVAISPDETRALFGYTTSEGFGTAVGGVFDVVVGDGTATEVAAIGNFDATWIDATRSLVNGLGLDGVTETGQGLYLRDGAASSRQLAAEIGAYSGSVAIVGDVIVAGAFAGFGTTWPDGSEGNRLFVIDRATAMAASAPISGWDDSLARFDGPSGFEVLTGSRIATRIASPRYDDTFAIAAIEARGLAESLEGGWVLAEPVDLTHGSAISDVVSLPGDRLLMVHAGGVLIVQE